MRASLNVAKPAATDMQRPPADADRPNMASAEALKQARRVHIRTRRLVDGAFAGEYRSVFRGQGLEFAEVREYAPGDDVRTIDWNVTARLGYPFVKQYVEERELTVMLLVDMSASGRFGSVRRFKAEVAREVCAVIALSAIANNDKVGLILFTDEVERFVPPRAGRNRVLHLIRELMAFEPRNRGTDPTCALGFFHKVIRRRCVTFLISDFLAVGYEPALRVGRQKHDVIPVVVSDPREADLPDAGLLALEDLESGERVLVDSSSVRVRAAYRARHDAMVDERLRLFRSLGLDSIEISTDEPVTRPLLRLFRAREGRHSGRR